MQSKYIILLFIPFLLLCLLTATEAAHLTPVLIEVESFVFSEQRSKKRDTGPGEVKREALNQVLLRAYEEIMVQKIDGDYFEELIDDREGVIKYLLENKELSITKYPDGSVRIRLKLLLEEEYLLHLLADVIEDPDSYVEEKEKIKEVIEEVEEIEAVQEVEEVKEPEYEMEIAEVPYTGLIVDARGLGVKPSMSPSIIDQRGKEVFGTLDIPIEVVIERGIVGYVRSMEEARDNPRSGDDPLLIEGLAAEGPIRQNVVISAEDADYILDLFPWKDVQEDLAVVIIIDS